ncbi:hypothetical protein KB879_38260 (plasmid) [Cupriavidus sp. KK10]|jgi:hypothetical protein|nr:hypothetical protein [Cupriavidus sp. KK10]QUN32093.1 hypothetical protein KB879_38260 [Cupriavidus sp. KK10]
MNAEFAAVVPHPAAGVMLARSRAAHRNELNSIPWLLLRFLEQARGRLQRRTRLMSNSTELAGKRAADVASSNDPDFHYMTLRFFKSGFAAPCCQAAGKSKTKQVVVA